MNSTDSREPILDSTIPKSTVAFEQNGVERYIFGSQYNQGIS